MRDNMLICFKSTRVYIILLLAVLFSFFECGDCCANSSDVFKIIDVVPSGSNVENVTQIAIRFNRPVIPFGGGRDFDLPIKIDPDVNCKWQWANVDLVICYLKQNEKLKFSTIYKIKIDESFKAFDGAQFVGDKEFSFSTLRPDIINSFIRSWKAPGRPIIQINFNQFVDRNSIEKALYFLNDDTVGSTQKYNISLIDETKLLSEYDIKILNDEFNTFFKNDENKKFEDAKKIVFIEPKNDLMDGGKFKLILDNGLKSFHGSELNIGAKEVLSFKTFGKPEFLGISCYAHENGKYENIQILVNDRNNNSKKCLPNNYIGLIFTSPISSKEIVKYLKFSPEISSDVIKNSYDSLSDQINNDPSQIEKFGYYVNSNENYQFNIYGNLNPNTKYSVQSSAKKDEDLAQKVKNFFNFRVKKEDLATDVFGRVINSKVELDFIVDHYEPQLFFPNYEDINVLESSTKNDIWFTARNFKSLFLKYSVISDNENSRNQEMIKDIDVKDDIFVKVPIGIREILHGKTGLVFGEVFGYPTDSSYSESKNIFMTQVTNFGIIAKIGHYNSLIYVTDLVSGAPVRDAEVRFLKSKFLEFNGEESQVVVHGKTDKNGIAILEGTESFDKNLKNLYRYYDGEGLIIEIEKDDEMGWLPIRHNHMMSTSNNNYIYGFSTKKYHHLLGWGFTFQGIYKPGEEVKYKLYVRNNENDGVKKAADLSYKVQIVNKLGNVVFEKEDVKLSEFGSYVDLFKLGQNAETGWYDINLIPNLKDSGIEKDQYENDFIINACRFLVSDFKTSPFRVRTETNKKNVFYQDELEISNYGEFYSGGAYSNANISVNLDIEPKIFDPSMNNPTLNGFVFYDEKQQERYLQRVLLKSDKLNGSGEYILRAKIENDIPYGSIIVDSNVQDDNGKTVASRVYAKYFGVDRFVGLKSADWFFNTNKNSEIDFVVVDSRGSLVKDVDINIQIQRSDVNVVQVRNGGDSYSPQTKIIWEKVDSCDKKSIYGIEKCNFIFKKSGNYRATATIRDDKNREHRSDIDFIVFNESENIVWKSDNNETFDIVAEKNDYKVGEKARFMIKNPLVGSNALITIERYGVLKQFTKKFDKSLEVLEFDLTEKDAPGFYLSVVLTMPRLKNENNASENQSGADYSSDLYKPIAKIGYSKINVIDPKEHVKVNILTDKEIYEPRENVSLKVSLDESSIPNEIEGTVLVIDDAVLDLVSGGVNYFNPQNAFTRLQDLDIANYSLFKTILTNSRVAMMKGADQGGDVGFDMSIRANFENLAFYKENIILKKGQKNDIKFELPDNLTSWRVVVVSNDKNALFGMNSKTFKANKETEIRSLLPHHVLAGDKFNASFTIFNRSDERRTIKFDASFTGSLMNSSSKNVYNEDIILDPFTRKIINFPVSSIDSQELREFGDIKFVVKAHDLIDFDGAEFSVKVLPAYVGESVYDNAVLGADESELERVVKIDSNADLSLSSMKISINDTILNNMVNIFSFVRDYKYGCLEQVLSKLLVSANYLDLRSSFAKNEKTEKSFFGDFIWDGVNDVIKTNFEKIYDYQAENGGFAYYVPSNAYADPYLSAMTLDVLNKISALNKNLLSSQILKSKLIAYLSNLLRYDNNFNGYYDKATIADTRAFILDVLSTGNEISVSEVNRFSDLFEKMSLFGRAKILNAGINLKINVQQLNNWLKDLMEYKVISGKYVSFGIDINDYSWINHATKYTQNCAVLSTLLNLEKNFDVLGVNLEITKDLLGDTIVRLANGIINRVIDLEKNAQHRMFSTHEAAICVDALSNYARMHEVKKSFSREEKVNLIVSSQNDLVLNETVKLPYMINLDNLNVFKNGNGKLKIEKSANDNNIYYNGVILLNKYLNFTDEYNKGLGILRKYQIQRGDNFVDVDNLSSFKSGDIVKVVLKIDASSDRYFVVVEDYIPGCFEPIDENIETSVKIRDNNGDFYFKDLKKDYVRFYSDYLRSGEYEMSYYVQATSKGRFTVMPAKTKEMYNEDINGSTKTDIVFVS